jgi:hypothetical protein
VLEFLQLVIEGWLPLFPREVNLPSLLMMEIEALVSGQIVRCAAVRMCGSVWLGQPCLGHEGPLSCQTGKDRKRLVAWTKDIPVCRPELVKMRVKSAREEECAGFRCRNGASCEVGHSKRHVWELRNRRDLPCVRVRGSVYKEQREAFSNEETICLMERFQSCKLVRAFKTPGTHLLSPSPLPSTSIHHPCASYSETEP